MTEHYNKPRQTQLRRMLRRNLSKAEAVMWKFLSRKQMRGYKFRRQYGVDHFVIDFYCPELKLAIEIDGDSHFRPGEVEKDEQRQHYLENFGIRFLRFSNSDVYQSLHAVLETIESEIKQSEQQQLLADPLISN